MYRWNDISESVSFSTEYVLVWMEFVAYNEKKE